MSRQSPQQQKRFLEDLTGMEIRFADGAALAEVEGEARAAEVLRLTETAYSFGAPQRVFDAGIEAIRAYAHRASLLSAMGLRIDPEQIVRDIVAALREAEEQPAALQAADIQSLERQIAEIEQTVSDLVQQRSGNTDDMGAIKGRINELLSQRIKLLAELGALRAKAKPSDAPGATEGQ